MSNLSLALMAVWAVIDPIMAWIDIRAFRKDPFTKRKRKIATIIFSSLLSVAVWVWWILYFIGFR